MATTKRNEIIIGGIRHIFKERNSFYPCRKCSLRHLYSTDPICQKVFGREGYFEVYNK